MELERVWRRFRMVQQVADMEASFHPDEPAAPAMAELDALDDLGGA